MATCAEIVPPYPDLALIEPARIPEPALLKESATDIANAFVLMQAYKTAIAKQFGVCWSFRGVTSDIASMLRCKHTGALVDAIPSFIEFKIPPIPWVAFSSEVWNKYAITAQARQWDAVPSQVRHMRRGPPPIRWTFSPGRMQNKAEWFWWMSNRWKGGRIFISKTHRVLISRWWKMRNALLAKGTTDPKKVTIIVKQHLPKAMFEALVEKAQTEGLLQQRKINEAIKRGEWVWQ